MGEQYDVNRLMRRPCNFHQMQNEWPRLVDYLTATDPATGSASGVLPIGTVLMWALGPSTIPAGWAIMDGTANAAGSGINMTGRFPRGHATTAGTTGGSATHTPTGSVSISGVTGTVSVTVSDKTYTGTNTVSVDLDLSTLESDSFTIPAHAANHYHDIDFTLSTIDTGDGTTGNASVVTGITQNTSSGYTQGSSWPDDTFLDHSSDTATFTGASAYTTDATFSLSGWNHGHAATGSFSFGSGTASFTGNSQNTEPPYATIIFIERIS